MLCLWNLFIAKFLDSRLMGIHDFTLFLLLDSILGRILSWLGLETLLIAAFASWLVVAQVKPSIQTKLRQQEPKEIEQTPRWFKKYQSELMSRRKRVQMISLTPCPAEVKKL